ncbi:MAG: hypothetical protein H6551_12135 [Chitinophagales bacterium]|nr:hypothetical protein [Chitinophagaceae bacterium]MCB9065878.1 hypothetical protein [Chitinophagales bacterium]
MRTKFLGTYDGITKINTEPVIIDSAIVDAYGAEPEIYIQFFLYSRGTLEKYIGRVYNSTEVEVTDVPSGKTVTMDYIGNDRIEILIEETTADGKLSYTQFQGTKRTK